MPEASSAQYARQYRQITGERALAANGALDALIRKTPTERLPELVSNAEVNLTRSITLNEQLAQSIEAAKGRAALGRLMIRRGDTVKAIAYLRPVRREFLRHGLIEEAGICGLEIVEGMLALGNASAAGTLSRRIIGEFMNAGLNKRAITALGYLQESIASAGASTALVSKVREYIVSLRISPERDFASCLNLRLRRGSGNREQIAQGLDLLHDLPHDAARLALARGCIHRRRKSDPENGGNHTTGLRHGVTPKGSMSPAPV